MKNLVKLDVCELLEQGESPFEAIMESASRVGPNGRFELICLFEPLPIYVTLLNLGFQIIERNWSGDYIIILFEKLETQQAELPLVLLDLSSFDLANLQARIASEFTHLQKGQAMIIETCIDPNQLPFSLPDAQLVEVNSISSNKWEICLLK